MDPRLREAARTGNIDILYALIQEDPYILERIDQVPFVDTPFHIAAFEGHINFVLEMMNIKPSFARKLNQDGFSPMHLALKNEQTKLVIRLLKTDKDLARVKGREGMTPFHFVTKTGNLDLLVEFLEACPECIEDVTVNGDTALHLALKCDNIKALDVLVEWLRRNRHKNGDYWEREIVNLKDNDDNTVVHIAAKRKQYEVLKHLLGSFIGVLDITVKNSEGLTAAEIIEPQNADRKVKMNKSKHEKKSKYLSRKLNIVELTSVRLARLKKSISLDVLNAILVITALVITATYQSSLSPPGGVWQGGDNGSNNSSTAANITSSAGEISSMPQAEPVPGTAVMFPGNFPMFWVWNSLTLWVPIFLTSWLLPSVPFLSVILMPLYFLGACYQYSMSVISPYDVLAAINFYMALLIPLVPFFLMYANRIRSSLKIQAGQEQKHHLLKILQKQSKKRKNQRLELTRLGE